jgi:hypothetical protein
MRVVKALVVGALLRGRRDSNRNLLIRSLLKVPYELHTQSVITYTGMDLESIYFFGHLYLLTYNYLFRFRAPKSHLMFDKMSMK